MTAARRTLVWEGVGEARAEIAFVEVGEDRLRARGTQVAADPEPYRLSYELETSAGFVTERLRVEAEGEGWERSLELRRGEGEALVGVLDCDLGFSPLFNSLPVLRHGLHRAGGPTDFRMAWVSVPDLAVRPSEQRYEPLGGEGLVRYRAGSFSSELEFDADGFVVFYPGLAERVFPAPGDTFVR